MLRISSSSSAAITSATSSLLLSSSSSARVVLSSHFGHVGRCCCMRRPATTSSRATIGMTAPRLSFSSSSSSFSSSSSSLSSCWWWRTPPSFALPRKASSWHMTVISNNVFRRGNINKTLRHFSTTTDDAENSAMSSSSNKPRSRREKKRRDSENKAPSSPLINNDESSSSSSSSTSPSSSSSSSTSTDSSVSNLQHEEWIKFQKSIAVQGFETGQTLSVQRKMRGGKRMRKRQDQLAAQAAAEATGNNSIAEGGQFPALRYSDEETERLLIQAYENLPPRAGKRGTRNLRRQHRRWFAVRKARKKQKRFLIAAHYRKMAERSRNVKDVLRIKAEAESVRQSDRDYQESTRKRWADTMVAGLEAAAASASASSSSSDLAATTAGRQQ